MSSSSLWKWAAFRRAFVPYVVAYFVALAVAIIATVYHRQYAVTLGYSVSLFAILLLFGWVIGPVRKFQKRLAEEDFCAYCDYSLTGHGSEGVCPECGEDIGESRRLLKEYRKGK